MVKSIPFSLLAFGAVWTFMFLYAANAAYRASVRILLTKLASISIVSRHPFGFVRGAVASIDNLINNGLRGTERVIVYSINRAAEPFILMVGVLVALGLGLWELAQYVVHIAPKAISRTVHETVVKPVTKTITVVRATSNVAVRALTHRVDVLAARVRAIAVAIPRTVASPFPRIGRIEKTAKAQAKRLSRVEKLLAASVGVALLVKAMSKLGLGWLRCSNVSKTGKRLCGMDSGLLDALLAGTVLYLGTISLVEFAEEVQSITDEAAGAIRTFVRAA